MPPLPHGGGSGPGGAATVSDGIEDRSCESPLETPQTFRQSCGRQAHGYSLTFAASGGRGEGTMVYTEDVIQL